MEVSFKATEDKVRVLGRTRVLEDIRYMDYSCSGIEFEFLGTKASVKLCSDRAKWEDNLKAWIAVFIDDESKPSKRMPLEKDEAIYDIYESNELRRVKIRLMKISESAFAKVGIKEILVEGNEDIHPTAPKERRIEFIGDSITCGYGIEGLWNVDTFNTTQENPWEAYAAKTAHHFNADFNCVSWSGIGVISSWTDEDVPNTKEWLMPNLYKYTDAALDKSFGMDEYEIWDNHKFHPDLVVINLGTNDASYTKTIKERMDQFSEGYYKFLQQVRRRNPNSHIICTLGAMGHELCPAVKAAVDKFKMDTEDEKIHTMFFQVQLESDGIGSDWHPSLKTQDKMSQKLIDKVKEIMVW